MTAPFDGVVGRRSAEVGATVSPGQPLVALLENGASWVTANFKETQISEMDAGDRVEVRVDAFPGAVFRGHVESLSPATGARYALLPPDNATGNFTKVVQRVPVRIALDTVDGDHSGLPDGARSRGRRSPSASRSTSVSASAEAPRTALAADARALDARELRHDHRRDARRRARDPRHEHRQRRALDA